MADPPCGSPGREDISDGKLDLDASLIRETREETGVALSPEHLGQALVVTDAARVVYLRPVHLRTAAVALCAEIAEFIAGQSDPELAGVVAVKDATDFDGQNVPPFVSNYLQWIAERQWLRQ